MSLIIGKLLRDARREQKLSLEQAAQATHIRLHYLQAMEAGDFASLPSALQMRGFLRSYAGYLSLAPQPLLDALESGEAPPSLAPGASAAPITSGSDEKAPADTLAAHFLTIGKDLKEQRELLGLSLEDVERHTHLRQRYLQALEDGDLAGLPSPVQGRGMLSNYATFLSLNPEPLLLRFAEGLQTQLSQRRPETPGQPEIRPTAPPRKRRLINRDILLGGLLAITLVVFGIWGGLRIAEMRANTESIPTPPSIAEVLLPSPTALALPTPTATLVVLSDELQPAADIPVDQPTPETNPVQVIPANATGLVQVQIVVQERTFMRALVDGEIVFDGRVLPGSAYLFVADERVEIIAGSGSALRITYNQQELGALGNLGQLSNQIFTLEGMQTPTPAISPTPEITPEATQTPGP